jgi:hypothetical protein
MRLEGGSALFEFYSFPGGWDRGPRCSIKLRYSSVYTIAHVLLEGLKSTIEILQYTAEYRTSTVQYPAEMRCLPLDYSRSITPQCAMSTPVTQTPTAFGRQQDI